MEERGMTTKLKARLEKFEKRLIVALQSGIAQALPAAEKLESLLEKRPEAKVAVSAEARAALTSVRREREGAARATALIAQREEGAPAISSAASTAAPSGQPSPGSVQRGKGGGGGGGGSVSADVSVGVVTLADLKLAKPAAVAARAAHASALASGAKTPSIAGLAETPEEKARRIARAARFDPAARQSHGPRAQLPAPVAAPGHARDALEAGKQRAAAAKQQRQKRRLNVSATDESGGGGGGDARTPPRAKRKRPLLLPAAAVGSSSGSGSSGGSSGSSSGSSSPSGDEGLACASGAVGVVGECLDLEKPYFRLTSAPKPAEVRPAFVLAQALEHIKAKWKAAEDAHEAERGRVAAWACEQFKSLRQDMVVQHLSGALPIKVYETHGRVALECGDLNEYNQCASKLHELYATPLGREIGCADEFGCYRLLHCLVHADDSKAFLVQTLRESALAQTAHRQPTLTSRKTTPKPKPSKSPKRGDERATTTTKPTTLTTRTEMTEDSAAARPKKQQQQQQQQRRRQRLGQPPPLVVGWGPLTGFAVAVILAHRSGDYQRFFALYRRAPAMSGYLLDYLVDRVRRRGAWPTLLKAYAPAPLPLPFLAATLAFTPPPQQERPEQPGGDGRRQEDAEDAEEGQEESGGGLAECLAFVVAQKGVLCPPQPGGGRKPSLRLRNRLVDTKASRQRLS